MGERRMGEADRFDELVRDTGRLLKRFKLAGLHRLPVRRGFARTAVSLRADKAQLLAPVREKALRCRKCRLSQSRKQVVFGEGSLDAKLLFIGEGPGRDEDLQGRPFVGAAGKLLTKIIQAMKLTRESVYIMNVVKCRPPNNRPPEADEVEACHEYLEAQLSIIAPKVIVALGRTAANSILQTDAPMRDLRGKVMDVNGSALVVTFHPAYLLRNPSAKADVWADMKAVMKLLNKPLPQ